MPEVADIVAGRDLRLAPLALQEHVRPLGHPTDVPAGQDLQEDLVADRVQVGTGYDVSSDEEVAAHRVGHASDRSRQEQ